MRSALSLDNILFSLNIHLLLQLVDGKCVKFHTIGFIPNRAPAVI